MFLIFLFLRLITPSADNEKFNNSYWLNESRSHLLNMTDNHRYHELSADNKFNEYGEWVYVTEYSNLENQCAYDTLVLFADNIEVDDFFAKQPKILSMSLRRYHFSLHCDTLKLYKKEVMSTQKIAGRDYFMQYDNDGVYFNQKKWEQVQITDDVIFIRISQSEYSKYRQKK